MPERVQSLTFTKNVGRGFLVVVVVVVDVTKPAYVEARETLLILHFSIKTRKFREVKNVSAILSESYR